MSRTHNFKRKPCAPIYRTKKYARDRAALIAAFQPGQPCCLCGHPLHAARYAEAQHDPGTETLIGLAHGTKQPCPVCGKRCNQTDGAKRGQARQQRKQKPVTNLRWSEVSDLNARPWLRKDWHACPICQTIVEWASQRTCSRACWAERLRRERLAKAMCPKPAPAMRRTPSASSPKTLTCEHCQQTFTATRRKRYCTKQCIDRAGMQRRHPHEQRQQYGDPTPCQQCGTPIAVPRKQCDTCRADIKRRHKRDAKRRAAARRRLAVA